MPFDLVDAAAQLGIMASLVLYFVWRSGVREKRLNERIQTLENFIRNQLLEALKDVGQDHHLALEIIKRTNDLLSEVEKHLARINGSSGD